MRLFAEYPEQNYSVSLLVIITYIACQEHPKETSNAANSIKKNNMAIERPRFNNHFVVEEDVNYLPPYMRDVPETPKPTRCPTSGSWPEWVHGSLIR